MKFKSIFSSAAVTVGFLLSLAAGPAQADTTFIPNYMLKSKGVNLHTTEIVNLSPDNKLLLCLERIRPVRGKQTINTIYIIPISSTRTLGDVRAFPLEGEGRIGNLAFTPDSKAVLFTSMEGTKLTKLDCETGELTTIMEHEEGKPGFVLYPQILEQSRGKLLALGYHYNSDNFAGPRAIAEVDASKTGLDAFVKPCLIEHVLHEMTNMGMPFIREGFPMKDVGFIVGMTKGSDKCTIVSWDGARGVIDKVEDGLNFQDCVSADCRLVYSIQDLDGTYKLCIYDAKESKKYTIDSGLQQPHYYTLMSSDGKTIVFSDQTGEAKRYTTYYARESEGWKIKPIEGLEKRFAFGRQRVSCDGTRMVFHNDDGLRIVDLIAPKEVDSSEK